jgi:hypothetical protein
MRPAFAASLILFLAAGPAPADVFHLRSGATLDGQLVEQDQEQYTIRTAVAVVRVPVSAVERIEKAPSPFDEYNLRVARAADTPEDQTALAAWCEEQGLRAERRRHLLRAIELNADYAPARRALGYVRVGELWVDGRQVVARGKNAVPAEDADQPSDEELARAIQIQWRQRIRAIRQSMLDSRVERLAREGRARILEIRDPLAILPLTETLSRGNAECRLLLVEALSAFPEDEATMNLAVIGLVDPEREVRGQAVAELSRRKDPRVVAQYRQALRTGNDAVLARAASGLGHMQAAEAIPELIDALTARRTKWVEVPVQRYFTYWPQVFTATTVAEIGLGREVIHRPRIGVCHACIGLGCEAENTWQFRPVTVYRTEVLEALKRITGQNFGFEHDQWHRWYEESQQ